MNQKAKPKTEDFSEYGSLNYTAPRMPLVYGPVESRRFGASIGINLLGEGEKICSFSCPYCDLGPTSMRLNRLKTSGNFASLEDLSSALHRDFSRIHAGTQAIKAITISGNGEPTLYPFLPEAIELILKARVEFFPTVPVHILTNGVHLDSRKTIEALNRLDGRMVKVDAGSDAVLKTINAPLVRPSVSKLISGIHQLKDVIAQSFFVQGAVDNTTPADIEDWIEVIGLIRPKAVHIHGMSHVPSIHELKRVDEDTLYMIASKLERRTQIHALVFP
jgi:wyosine [tRNA(Phe)-imidazoG37] synthetase (radical SAM superfamily)